MLEKLNKTPSLSSVTDYEEKIWMLQLQQPEQINRSINLWKLNQDLDTQFFIQAIQEIIKTNPDLNVCYKFSDEGDLYKQPFDDHSFCFELKKSNAEKIFEQLAKLKAQSWDAEIHPPFFTSLIETEQDFFLILALHPILDESYQKLDFIQAIQDRYQRYSPNNKPMTLTEIDTPNHLYANCTKGPDKLVHSHVSEIILEEFRTILDEPEMSQNDDFFDFGGHSLLATRIIGNLLNKHGIEIHFNDFFKSSSAANLAQYAFVKSIKTEKTTLQSVNKAPLTLTQNFLWQAYSSFDYSPIYNLPFAVEFLEEINEEILFQAFSDIVERHAGLRTIFKSNNGETYQQVVPSFELKQFKWYWSNTERKDITLASEAAYKFDLSRELPIRIHLIRNTKGRQTLSFLVHHIVIDEWSLNTIMADLSHAFLARSNAQVPSWNAPAQSILDFSLVQQKQGINQDHLKYWTEQLKGASKGLAVTLSEDELNAEKDRSKVKWLELKFEAEMYAKLLTFSRQEDCSIFAVLYTAIANALQQQFDLKDIVIGTSASGRTNPEFFDTVGYFTTMVAHRTQFIPSDSFQSLLHDISTMINTSMAYADIPINHIQNALEMPIDEGLLFDVFIHIHSNNALNGVLKTAQGQDIPYRQILPERNESMFGLHFEIMENVIDKQHQLSMIITYQAHRYPTSTVKSICEKIKLSLAQI